MKDLKRLNGSLAMKLRNLFQIPNPPKHFNVFIWGNLQMVIQSAKSQVMELVLALNVKNAIKNVTLPSLLKALSGIKSDGQ
jgi:hypothetical protein